MTDIHESKTPKTVAEEWGQIKKELSAIVNVLVSMAAVFTGVWYVGFGYSHPLVSLFSFPSYLLACYSTPERNH
jgi:hypothetical protein